MGNRNSEPERSRSQEMSHFHPGQQQLKKIPLPLQN